MMINFRNAKYADPVDSDNRRIDVEIELENIGWIPYTIDDNDTDQTIDNVELKERVLEAGVADYTPPPDDVLAAGVRIRRDNTLSKEVDPVVSNPLRWGDMTTAEQNAWSQYRTDLLNITDQSGFPHNVTWPTKP